MSTSSGESRSSPPRLRDIVVIGFGLILAVLMVGGVLGYVNIQRLIENEQKVARTHKVIGELEVLLSTLKDAETGQRGYLLTEDEKYLQPYNDAVERVQAEAARLEELTSDKLDQQARFTLLELKIAMKLDELKRTVALMKGGNRAAALKIVRSDTGKTLMDDVRNAVADMQQAGQNLVRQRSDESEASSRTAIVSILLPIIIGIILLGVVFALTQRNLIARHRAAEAIAKQREQLRVTLASIGDAVISTDTEGRVTYLNAVAESLTGWNNDEAVGVPLTQVFHIVNESTRQTVDNPALRALQEGMIVGLANHTILIAKDGTERPIDDSAAPIREATDKILGAVLVFRDITNRKQAEAALHYQSDLIRSITDNATTALFMMDDKNRCTFMNPAAERMAGFTFEEVKGGILHDFIHHHHPDDRPYPMPECPIARALPEHFGMVDHEDVFIRQNGEFFPVLCNAKPIHKDGVAVGTILEVRDITQQKRSEEAIRESEQRLRFIMDSMPQKIFTATPSGDVDYFNPLWMEFTGLPFETIRNWGWMPFIHPDDVEENIHVWQHSIDTGELFQLEHRFRRADGEYHWHLSRALPMWDEAGRIILWIGSSTDVHDVKKASEALYQNEERLRAALTNSDTGTFRWNPHTGEFFEVDESLKRLLGFAPDEPVQVIEDFIARVHPNDVLSLIPAIERCRQGADFEMEFRVILPDGSIRWLYNRAKMVRDEQGEPIYLVGACTDITKRKQAEMLVRENEQRFRALIEQVKDYAIFMIDPQGRATTWNEGVRRVLGYEEAEFIGKDSVPPSIFTPKDVQSGVPERELEKAAAVGTAGNDRWMRRKDGALFWAVGVTTSLRDDEGKLVGFMKVMRDQTEQRRLEDELRQVAADLSEANRRKTEFLSTLGHELRNPLAPICTGLELMKMVVNDPARIEETRSMMERQAQQLVRLIDDLLDVSRITQGKLQLRKARVALADVVQSAVEASRPFIDEADHELTLTIPQQPIFLHADPNRLAQVFSNLLNNATKYTPGGGHIWLTAERQGCDVLVMVKDSGIGIPADLQIGIFKMFIQIDRPLEKGYKGLGIGLTLVKRLVEMHGGRIEVCSEGPNKGSEFSVRLPILVEVPSPESQQPQNCEPAAKPTRLRILVVDDNKAAADMLGMVIKMLGNEVRTAYDGLQGVEVAAEFRPDMVLMDLGMPKMNGYEAARHIREQEWSKGMVLVALTGWGQDEDRQRTKETGFDHHLVKPAEPAALQRLLAELKPASV